jgi:dTDP-4-dehydrorhamnose 3,5-epimerase
LEDVCTIQFSNSYSRHLKILSEPFQGTHLLQPNVFADNRGDFIKTYNRDLFLSLGFDFEIAEEFYSASHSKVLRGMHFQLPPYEHEKLVYCIKGRVLDVLVDLRKDSPTFLQVANAELSAQNHFQFYIPKGIAHGFLALEDSVMVYKTSTVHTPSQDAGIRWDSIGFEWGIDRPIISLRDAALPAVSSFSSPF